jgi:hypothetical protein
VRGQLHAPPQLTPGKYPVPIIQEAGWASGQVWTVAENLAPTEIRSPDDIISIKYFCNRKNFKLVNRNKKVFFIKVSKRNGTD